MFVTLMTDKEPNSLDFTSLKEICQQIDSLVAGVIKFCVQFLKKNWLILIVATAIGLGWGLFKFYKNKPVYTFEMSVYHGDLEKKTFADILDKVNTVAGRGMKEELASLLNIPVSVASGINSINTETIDGRPLKNSYAKDEHPFKIRVVLSDPTIWKHTADAIRMYILKQPYMVRLMKINHERVEKEIVFLENEIAQLDVLKSNVNNCLEKGVIANDISLLKTLDIPGIYQKSLELYKEKERAINFLAFDEGVTVINHSASVNVPYSESFFKIIFSKWLLVISFALVLIYFKLLF